MAGTVTQSCTAPYGGNGRAIGAPMRFSARVLIGSAVNQPQGDALPVLIERFTSARRRTQQHIRSEGQSLLLLRQTLSCGRPGRWTWPPRLADPCGAPTSPASTPAWRARGDAWSGL